MAPAQHVSKESGAVVGPTVVTTRGPLPKRGDELGSVHTIPDGAVAWDEGLITYVGPAEGLDRSDAREASGTCLAPGFVDCHTHLPFFGWRADEFAARLQGRTYRDQHGEGGIYRSARMLSEASDKEVIAFCRPLLDEMLSHGTTAVEFKTGYGLSVEGELRQVRLARHLASQAPQVCTVTLLACHAVPPGLDREAWVRRACDELIPQAASESLVDAVDVYVEDIAFTLDDLRAVAEAARRAGLPVRVHADQLGPSGAAEAAVDAGARSADHLNHVSTEGVQRLGSSQTAAVLLPASTFMLRASPPPVRELLNAGSALAVASDFNPGTSPVLSMPEVLAMACAVYGFSPQAALTAATANAAWTLGLSDVLGTLEPGKRADFILLESDDPAMVPYRPGHDPVVATFVGGRNVWSRDAVGP